MNWEYALGVIAVILIISYGTLAVLKKRGKADQANKRTLFISTVIAIGFALLTPIFAKMITERFEASVLASILTALGICILLGVGVGVLTMIRRKQATDGTTGAGQNNTQAQGIEEVQIQLEDLQKSDEDLAIGFAEGLTAIEASLAEAAVSAAPEAPNAEAPVIEVPAEETHEDIKTEMPEVEAAISEASESLEIPVQDQIPTEEILPENEGDTTLYTETQLDSLLEKIVDTERITDRIGIEDTAIHQVMAWSEAQVRAKLAEAEEHKKSGRLSDSIACLYEILLQKPDEKLSTLIIIEICSLSKKLDNAQYVRELLESDAVNPLDATIKEEILSNI